MISILIPFRAPAGSWRDLLRAATAKMWAERGIEPVYGTDGRRTGHPWCAAAAFNDARRRATGDVLLVMGCDHVPPPRAQLDALDAELQTRPWAKLFEATRELSEQTTLSVLDGMPVPPDPLPDEKPMDSCLGIMALRADVWDRLRGFDERFEGWGYEDTALQLELRTHYPQGRAEGVGYVTSLWHPRPADPWADPYTARNAERYGRYERLVELGRLRPGRRP